ncbi:hypothetical protein SCHIN_v1c05100 [Spiroplasma chinense]|uniref:Uncharacterized protein n=1 Tax=Spiroplasma chinense TaxID=216932 RepID=A0A5B9Y600_9MOLU|nr:hypothetical protein [Spiroplasma chinense]QEH61707.1 hypothetical protein SCHIN_v1c05100 [Spiroplasma chinense]
MNNSKNKTSGKDFTLISEKTKARIRGLIEKRLTAQTIALFAQEYEAYEPEIRKEIIEYILFLLSVEEEALKAIEGGVADHRARMLMERRKLEFAEKQSNIRKIQDMLNKKPAGNQKPKVAVKLEEKPVKKEEPKKETKKQLSKLEQMLKEAQMREAKNLKNEKEQEKLEAERKAKEAAKKRKEEKAKLEKAKKEEQKKISRTPAKKPLSYDEKLLAAQAEQPSMIERDYEKEQREKERLWKELYGKTRADSLKERAKVAMRESDRSEADKTPTIEEILLVSYELYGNVYDIEELTDPKNKYYLFWSTMKQKYKVSNISIWIKEKPIGFQKKIYKKRLKIEKQISKKLELINKEKEMQEMKAKQEKERLAKEAAKLAQEKAEAKKQEENKENK